MAFARNYILVLLVVFSIAQPCRGEYTYNLSVWTMFRDEAPYLKEWIEFHKIVGVEHFFLYNNRSKDSFLEVLQPYIDAGEVDLYDWPIPINQWTQVDALKDCWQRHGQSTQWLAVLDCDEFLYPVVERTLPEFLKRYERFGGISVHWQMFGTSGIKSLEPSQLLTEHLVYKGHDNMEWYVKPIVQTRYALEPIDVHRWTYKPGYYSIDSAGNSFTTNHSQIVVVDQVRINHYWCRTEDFANNVKAARFGMWRNEDFDLEAERQKMWRRIHLYNMERDTLIHKYLPELKQRMRLP